LFSSLFTNLLISDYTKIRWHPCEDTFTQWRLLYKSNIV